MVLVFVAPTSQVMVTDASDESDADCSGDFTLVASTDVPDATDMGAYVTVTSPSAGDTAMAGGEYTVEVMCRSLLARMFFRSLRRTLLTSWDSYVVRSLKSFT